MNTGTAGRSLENACDEFLARHSEYLDGLLPPSAAARLGTHAGTCASCARYDRVVRKSMDLVRELPVVQPSDEFELRLQHRLLHEQDGDVLGTPRAAGAAVALGVAAVIALLAWSPLLLVNPSRTTVSSSQTSPAAAYAGGFMPLFDESAWHAVSLPAPRPHDSSALLAIFPGPYSPLIVTPPAHRTVRPVSTGYTPVD